MPEPGDVDVVRIHYPDGQWVDMRLASVDQQLSLVDSDYEELAPIEQMRFLRELAKDSFVRCSWGPGTIGAMSLGRLTDLLGPWLRATEDDAVPPPSGSSSDVPSPKPRSRRQTARGRRSATPASSAS